MTKHSTPEELPMPRPRRMVAEFHLPGRRRSPSRLLYPRNNWPKCPSLLDWAMLALRLREFFISGRGRAQELWPTLELILSPDWLLVNTRDPVVMALTRRSLWLSASPRLNPWFMMRTGTNLKECTVSLRLCRKSWTCQSPSRPSGLLNPLRSYPTWSSNQNHSRAMEP